MSSGFSYTTETSYDEFFTSRNTRSRTSKEITHKIWWGNSSDNTNKRIKTNYYFLNDEDNTNFIKSYLQSIYKKELGIGIYTKGSYAKPLYIQFNMKYTMKDEEEFDAYDFIKLVIEETCNILEARYALSEDKTENISVVMYPKKQRKGEYSFRIVFPYFWCIRQEITRYIIPMLKKKLQSSNAYKYLPVFPSNEQTMIGTIPDDFIPLYMTCEEGVVYNDFVVFEYNTEIDINDVFILENCIDSLYDVVIEDPNQKVALFTSIYHWRKPTQVKNTNMSSPIMVCSATSSATDDGNGEINMNSVDIFSQLYKFISSERKSKLYFIEDMACILKNIYNGPEGYEKWKSLFPNSDLIPTSDDWYKYQSDKLTINTMYYYASIDSKDDYKEWYHRTFILKALNKAYYEPYDANIAKAFKIAYPWQYVCVSHKQSNWYFFSTTHTCGSWTEMDNDVDISNKISNEFHEMFNIFKNNEDLISERGGKKTISKYEKLSSILLSSGSKKSVINELKTIYHNKNFFELLDSENYLTATTNCMIDARHAKVIIRDGRPEDYVSFSTGIPYQPNPSGMADLKKYLRQLFCDKGIRKYMKYMISSLLTSGNKDKIFPIFTGEGNNSKTILVSIIEKALGKYAGKVPTSLITGKRTQSSGATPELRQLLKCRIAFAQEPSKDEILNVGLIKEITGNDSLYTRQLFKDGEVSKINALLVLVCNRIPKIPDNQEAIWERIRVVPFKSKWIMNAPESEEEQFKQRIFKRDKYFDAKKSRMAIAMLSMMVKNYMKYKDNGLDEPVEMYNATKHLREKTNIYQLFVTERVDKLTMDDENYAKSYITIQEFHQAFSAWYKIEYKGNKAPTRTTFTEEIEALFQCKADGGKIYGISWKSNISQQCGAVGDVEFEFNV